jgi:hypothetical protein
MSQVILFRDEIPSSVTQENLDKALALLGLESNRTAEVHMRPGGITVTQFRTNDEGHKYVVDKEVAVITFDMEIIR